MKKNEKTKVSKSSAPELTPKQREVLQKYIKIVKSEKNYPTRAGLHALGVSRDVFRAHFGNLSNLRSVAEREEPKIFEKLILQKIKEDKEEVKKEKHALIDFTKDGLGNIIKVNNYKSGRFFVTAAAPTSYIDYTVEQKEAAEKGDDFFAENLHKKGFDTALSFCKLTGSELIVLPMPAHVKALKSQPQHYDPRLKPYLGNFATEYTFNNNLKAIEARINPQQVNSLTGLKRLKLKGSNKEMDLEKEIKRFKTSIIIAHSKQMMEPVATGNSTHPRILHSTGCITNPAYLRNRIGMLAEDDHLLGGLIVEIDEGTFHIRQARMDPRDGSFVDLSTRYFSDGTTKYERAEAFKIGDIHPGHHDQEVLNCLYEIWDLTQPKRIFYEDAYDGTSGSHHLLSKNITKAMLPEYFKTIPAELAMARKVLEESWNRAPKDAELFMTASNHPEHLMGYLERGQYINDCPENFNIAHRMVVMKMDGKNPLKEYLDPEGRMTWLHENDDYFIDGVQLAAHGHLGVNGSRQGKVGLETTYGSAIVAHSHTPSIYHELFQVGHSSVARHGYNKGPGTWITCSGLQYKRGQKQLIMIIKGKWRLVPEEKKSLAKKGKKAA